MMCLALFRTVSLGRVHHLFVADAKNAQIFRKRKVEHEKWRTQNVRGRYLDETKLRKLLEELFGKGNFRLGVSAFGPY
jgi:hypothetical protein